MHQLGCNSICAEQGPWVGTFLLVKDCGRVQRQGAKIWALPQNWLIDWPGNLMYRDWKQDRKQSLCITTDKNAKRQKNAAMHVVTDHHIVQNLKTGFPVQYLLHSVRMNHKKLQQILRVTVYLVVEQSILRVDLCLNTTNLCFSLIMLFFEVGCCIPELDSDTISVLNHDTNLEHLGSRSWMTHQLQWYQ